MANKWVYLFTEGNANMRELLGGKGANLAEMTGLGLPVPQGFTITTEACTQYYEDGREINAEIQGQINEYIVKMEEITGKKFGDKENPLLVSVRSGARASMPGMMDTILNLGLNEDVVEVIAKKSNNPRWAWDCYRRFIQMYSDVVMEVGKKYFEELIDKMKAERGVTYDVELTADDLKELAGQFKAEYKEKIGQDFPDDPKEQLMGAVKAVFRSWDNPRANVYRRDNDIPYSWGTAVNVQSMAFGNMGDDCGTGVAFTRDPATGEKKLMGEFLINAQGEDVVAGVRTPMPIAKMAEEFPEAFEQFQNVCQTLENHYRDMQDMEFTVENKKLYMLQTRNGKRTAQAALKIACDLVDEGMRTEEEAVAMIDPRNLDTLLHPQFDAAALKAATPIGKGLGASPGAACGKIVFTAEDAENWNAKGEKVVLVRLETSPEDITGMKASQGILTVRGGMTSHAAVVARGMGTCCVSGCGDIAMDEANKKFMQKLEKFMQGKPISEQEIGRQLLQETAAYAESSVCRRKILLHYFGEEYTEDNCGNCDNCLNPKKQVEAQDSLCAVIEAIIAVKENFKQDYIIDILLGKETSEVLAHKHEDLEVFGSGMGEEERLWNAVIRQALIAGYLAKDVENYGLLKVTPEGHKFLKKPKSFKIVEDADFEEEEVDETPMRSGASCAVDPVLYSMLKDLRKKMAKRLDVPPYVIFQDPSCFVPQWEFQVRINLIIKMCSP